MKVRHYDARMVVPLMWNEEGVTECEFVTRVFFRGKAVDQLQLHLLGNLGTYRIDTVCFDSDGKLIEAEGILPSCETGCPFSTFPIVKPAVDNTRVDMSPYGQSVFADAIDVIQAVDLAFDVLINEVDVSKMRIFLSDVLFDKESDGKGKRVSIPFGKQDSLSVSPRGGPRRSSTSSLSGSSPWHTRLARTACSTSRAARTTKRSSTSAGSTS